MTRGPRHARASGRRWSRLVANPDLLAVALLVMVPLAITIPFSVSGHPLLLGDNVNQNYPLRVLAGRELASGHLPLWDPWIWSGTPLLAGWNAGALFPGTWLFAVMPAVGAWTINVALVGIAAGTGAYVLLRMLSCRSFAALCGALAFVWAGFLAGQSVHIGLVQGTACMPWVIASIEGLRRRPVARAQLAWIALLGAASACTVLAGDPRAVSTTAIAALIYLIAAGGRVGRRGAVHLAATSFAGIALGAAASAAQWLPGLTFLHSSSRGQTEYSVFVSGSLSFPRLADQFALPFLMGGSGAFSTPLYQGTYNLPEVTIGVGFLALVAFFAYLPELARQFLAWLAVSRDEEGEPAPRTRAERSAPARRRLGVWYATAVVGIVLAAGSYTPLSHLLVHLPLFGGERLQNRNAALTDLALVVLLAFFVDDVLGRDRPGVADPLRTWTRRVLGVLAPLSASAVIAYAWAAPIPLERALRLVVQTPGFFDALDAYLIPAIATALAIAVFVLIEHRLSRRVRAVALVVLLTADLGIFFANADYTTQPISSFGKGSPTARRLAAIDGPFGRSAIFDPIFQVPANDPQAANLVGVTDVNILQENASVAGYGSAVNGVYQSVTGTHSLEFLNQTVLGDGTFDTLDLAAVLSPSVFFGEDIPPHSPIPVAGAPAVTADGLPGPTTGAPSVPPLASGPWLLSPHGTAAFVLPVPHTVVRVTVVINPQLTGRPRSVRIAIGETAPAGAARTGSSRASDFGLTAAPRFIEAPVLNGQVHLSVTPRIANTVLVENPTSGTAVVGAVVVVTRNPDTRVLLDGALQGDVSPPHWRFAASLHGFSTWSNTQAAGPGWLQRLSDTSPEPHRRAPGSVRELNTIDAAHPQFALTVPAPERFVWSEGYGSGWSARLVPPGHEPARTLVMRRFGLVQSAVVPAGSYRLILSYSPSAVRTGVVLSAIALVALLLALVALACWNPILASWRRRVAARSGRDRPSGGATA